MDEGPLILPFPIRSVPKKSLLWFTVFLMPVPYGSEPKKPPIDEISIHMCVCVCVCVCGCHFVLLPLAASGRSTEGD